MARITSSLLLALMVSLTGCLERLEIVKIGADGAVSVEHRIKGDGGDLTGGSAAMPSETQYAVTRFTRPRKNGKNKDHFLIAKARYGSVAQMPSGFAAKGAKHAARDLRFDNQLVTRKEDGRTRYIFTRTYAPRAWAHYRYQRRQAFPEEVDKLARTDWGKKPWSERRKVIQAMIDYERGKSVVWCAEALAAIKLAPQREAEAQSAARAALERHFLTHVTTTGVAQLFKMTAKEMVAQATQMTRRIEQLVASTVAQAVGLDKQETARFSEAFASARHDFEVSDDLGDESFEVRISMPGKIVSHNGRSQSGSSVTWKFDGKDLRDRSHRLIVISVVQTR